MNSLESFTSDPVVPPPAAGSTGPALAEDQLQLVETARLATMTRLIAAIDHELNAPLGALTNGLGIIWRYFERPCGQLSPAERAAIDEMRGIVDASCRRMIEVIAGLREFFHFDQAEMQLIDLRTSLDRAVDLLGPQLGRAVVRRVYYEIPPLNCRASQINQVLLEVLRNAVESIGEEGTVTLGVRTENDHVVATVADTGRGISADQLQDLFDPRLQAKDGQMRITLGLPLARKIIHEHGGRIRISSVPGRGTTVTIRLPLALPRTMRTVN